MAQRIEMPEVKILEAPTTLKAVLPKGFCITLYPKIYLSKETMKTMPLQVIQHELFHAQRQKAQGKKWFWKYVTSKSFRLDEEAQAYAFGFCFLGPEENILQWVDWAAGLLASSNYWKCAPSKDVAKELIYNYYLEFSK